jgi:hypothetical protein
VHPAVALSLRRVALMSAGLFATLVAHVVAVGDIAVAAYAPVTWVMLLLGAALCGSRGAFVPRGFLHTAILLTLVQLSLHAGSSRGPWAFGLVPHHEMPLIDVRAVAVHSAAALALALLLRGIDHILATAVALVRLLRCTARRRVGAPRYGRIRIERAAGSPTGAHRPRSSRGPPATGASRLIRAAAPT